MTLPRRIFLFLFFGQDGLHHVAGLGNVGEIDLGRNGLGSTRRAGAGMAPLATVLKVRANFVSLMVFDRTRVSLALTQTEFPEHVKNLTALDFHLTREIVNSNLAHPPLFRMCCPKPFSRPGVPNDWSSSLGWSKLPLGIGLLRCHHYHLNGVEKRDACYAPPSSFSDSFSSIPSAASGTLSTASSSAVSS